MMSIMFFIFLCFFGLAAILFYVLRCQERQYQMLREENAQLRVLLRAIDSRLDLGGLPVSSTEAAHRAPRPSQPGTPDEQDSLLHLNFDAPSSPAPGSIQKKAAINPDLDLHFDTPLSRS